MDLRHRSFLALTTFALSCGDYEGDDPGECSDAADNDRDGFFDLK